MSGKPAWGELRAPTLEEFEVLAAAAWREIPAQFRALAQDVLIRIEDFASREVLDSLDIQSEFDLLGLYQGVSLEHKSVMDVPQQPDTVMLYRRPILDYWAGSDETLGALVTHVLVHEIGHHFGLSDDDMEAIEARAGERAWCQCGPWAAALRRAGRRFACRIERAASPGQ